jgi:hypothetical protein
VPEILWEHIEALRLKVLVREEAMSTLLGHASTQTTRAAYVRLSIQTLADEMNHAMASNLGPFRSASKQSGHFLRVPVLYPLYFVRKEEDAEVAARRIQIRVTGRKEL